MQGLGQLGSQRLKSAPATWSHELQEKVSQNKQYRKRCSRCRKKTRLKLGRRWLYIRGVDIRGFAVLMRVRERFPTHFRPPICFTTEPTYRGRVCYNAESYPHPIVVASLPPSSPLPRVGVRATTTKDGVDPPVFPAVSQESCVFFPQTMGSINPQAAVRSCPVALTLLAQTPEEEKRRQSRH